MIGSGSKTGSSCRTETGNISSVWTSKMVRIFGWHLLQRPITLLWNFESNQSLGAWINWTKTNSLSVVQMMNPWFSQNRSLASAFLKWKPPISGQVMIDRFGHSILQTKSLVPLAVQRGFSVARSTINKPIFALMSDTHTHTHTQNSERHFVFPSIAVAFLHGGFFHFHKLSSTFPQHELLGSRIFFFSFWQRREGVIGRGCERMVVVRQLDPMWSSADWMELRTLCQKNTRANPK
ncbi:hypothetical protein B0O80DRAFT_87029 [Mortierella sp. GBAus27b]|nr:hypothetical protein B0O80DRAFT_87029 [Mortierella sp. GBAus27b]